MRVIDWTPGDPLPDPDDEPQDTGDGLSDEPIFFDLSPHYRLIRNRNVQLFGSHPVSDILLFGNRAEIHANHIGQRILCCANPLYKGAAR